MSEIEMRSVDWQLESYEFRDWIIDLDPGTDPGASEQPQSEAEENASDVDLPGVETVLNSVRDQVVNQIDGDAPHVDVEMVESTSDVFLFTNAENGRSNNAAVIDDDVIYAVSPSNPSIGSNAYGFGTDEAVELDYGRELDFAGNEVSLFDEGLPG